MLECRYRFISELRNYVVWLLGPKPMGKDGDVITALARDAAVAATSKAFALLRPDGSVIAWGAPGFC